MTSKLYVGNLNFQASTDDLRDVFSQFGNVEDVFLPLDRETGRPRGFAFVTMGDADSAQKAQEALDGQDFMERPLRVNEARENPPGGGGGGGGGKKPFRRENRGGGGGGGYGGDRRGGDRRGGGGRQDRRSFR